MDGRTFDALSLQITLNREGAYYTKAIRKVNEKKLDKHVVEKRKLDKGTSPVLNLLCLKTGEIFYAMTNAEHEANLALIKEQQAQAGLADSEDSGNG